MALISTKYDKNKRFILTNDIPYSPCMEVIDTTCDDIPVNINYRLSHIFFPISYINYDKEKQDEMFKMYTNDKKEWFSVITHFIANLDLLRGLKSLDLVMILEEEMIIAGRYSQEFKTNFLSLLPHDKYFILLYLSQYDISAQIKPIFENALIKIFDEIQIFYEVDTGINHIYINKDRCDYNVMLYNLIEFLFKDMTIKVEIMWKHELFGLVDLEETMIIDQLVIY